MSEKLEKTDAEWRQQLTEEQYAVSRQAGTEPAFSGKYWECKTDGIYRCVCCGNELFDSSTKFDSSADGAQPRCPACASPSRAMPSTAPLRRPKSPFQNDSWLRPAAASPGCVCLHRRLVS